MGCARTILVVFFAAAGLSLAQAGTMYKWVDSQGRVTYHDKPPPEGTDYRVEQKNLGNGGSSGQDNSLEKVIAKYPIVLYSVPVCGSCDLARAYLKNRNVPFTEHNLENNPEQQQKLKKKVGSLSAPTITIGEKVMAGYVESVLDGELNEVGYPKMSAGTSSAGNDDRENREEKEGKSEEEASAPDEAGDQPVSRRY